MMDEKQMLAKVVNMVIKQMTDDELITHRMIALLGGSHKGRDGYEKMSALFSQENDTKMHQDTLELFVLLSGKKLGLED
jgi:hypothetical protein